MVLKLFFINIFALVSQLAVAQYELAEGITESQSFDKFYELTQKNKSISVEDFLTNWKNTDPLIFRYYLLSYRSRSLQSATFGAPRVILFSPIGDFIASFNSHKATRGSQNIEVIRFNHTKETFEFYELSFSGASVPQLSAMNPQKCLDCHQSLSRAGADPRPNWEPYFLWPGFYGSPDNKLLNSTANLTDNEKARIDPIADWLMLEEIPQERSHYQTLWSDIFPNTPRYSLLEPYNKNTGKLDSKLYSIGANREIKNSYFTQRIAQLNFRRVIRLIKEDSAFFEYIKEAVVAVVECKADILPLQFVKWLEDNSTLKGQKLTYNRNFGDRIKFLFEPFYFDTDDWSMDFKTNGRFAFTSRFGTPGFHEKELLRAMKNSTPEIQKLLDLKCGPEFVALLKKYDDSARALTVQESRSSFKKRIEAVKSTPLINRCIRCHAQPTDLSTPRISFDDEERLRKELEHTGYNRGRLFDEIVHRISAHASSDEQMPPRGLPTEQQRQDLINRLKQIMGASQDSNKD